MSPSERRSVISLAGIYSLRMLGLFMILPVFALHATSYRGYTATLAGLAIGVYGLTQAIFQIPFGRLSDKIGRKPVITAGLLIFCLGSIVAAMSDSMLGVITGRALQGTGAIAAAVMAMTADLTHEDNRTKAMAMIGASIGAAFALALILGPMLSGWFGMAGIFWSTAVLALGAVILLHLTVSDPKDEHFHRDTGAVPGQFFTLLRDPQLLRLYLGILLLHLVMTATFVVLPLSLLKAGLSSDEHWWIYLVVLLGSVLLMLPAILLAERHGKLKAVFLGAIGLLLLAETGLYVAPPHATTLIILMLLFFTGFNVLEANLPSLASRLAPADKRGSVLGIYSTAQFFGAFLGGLFGGWLHSFSGLEGVFGLCAAASLLWLALASGMHPPRKMSNRILRLSKHTEPLNDHDIEQQLLLVNGVIEAVVRGSEHVAYLKVDRLHLDEDSLRAIASAGG